jgi:hypothetical protein
MSTTMFLVVYWVVVGAVLVGGGYVARRVLVATHYNEDATLEVHRLGGTGKLALSKELERFGWEAQGARWVTEIAGRTARLEFASGKWRLEVDAREGAEVCHENEVRLEWGWRQDARSHGWEDAAQLRCEDVWSRAVMAHEEVRGALADLAAFAPPRGETHGVVAVRAGGGFTLDSGPQRRAAVLEPRDWSSHATLVFERLTRALDLERPGAHDALAGVVADASAPTHARAMALESLRRTWGAGESVERLATGARDAPLELKIQWALTAPGVLPEDEAYGLLAQGAMGAGDAEAIDVLAERFALRACADRKLGPTVRANALAVASRAGHDVTGEIERVLAQERGAFRMTLVERLGEEDPEALRKVAWGLIEEGDEPVVRRVVAALVRTQEARDRDLLMRALEAPGGHHGELIEALEAHGDAPCARALAAYGSRQPGPLGREASAAATRIAARVGALGSLSVSEDARAGGLEIAHGSGRGDLSEI